MRASFTRGLRRAWVFFLGSLFVLVLLEGSLWLVGFVVEAQREANNARANPEPDAYRIMCLGDSITAGGKGHSYPRQLEDVLNERAKTMRFSVVNMAIHGSDTSMTLENLPQDLDRYRPDMVVAMMGANDLAGALPVDDIPMAEREGGGYTFKTYKLIRLLQHNLDGRSDDEEPDMDFSMMVHRPEDVDPDSGHPDAHRQHARFLAWQGDVEEAERILHRLMDDPPPGQHVDRVAILMELAEISMGEGIHLLDVPAAAEQANAEFDEAVALLSDILHAQPTDRRAREMLGRVFEEQGKMEEARAVLAGELPVIPGVRANTVADYPLLGEFLARRGRCEEALEILLIPEAEWRGFAPTELAITFCQIRLGGAEEMWPTVSDAIESTLGRGEDVYSAYRPMVELYEGNDDQQGLNALLEKIEWTYPNDPQIQALLARNLVALGDERGAQEHLRKARQLTELVDAPLTRQSYNRMHRILDRRGVKMVVAGYPRRSAEPTRGLFDDPDGVLFVDNDAAFERELSQHSYDALFTDSCYGDFGHGTAAGNRLTAETIAAAILSDLEPGQHPPSGPAGE